MKYVFAEKGEVPAGCEKSLRIYYDELGNKMVRFEGSRSWRNNNPGNIKYFSFARENGAIGTDGTFAIFPDEETGQRARKKLLQGSKYYNLTVLEMAARYEPERPVAYCDCICSKAGLDRDRLLSSLSEEEFSRLLHAMQNCEGWEVGEEHYFPLLTIVGTRRGKDRTFQVFNVSREGWKSKSDTILLAEKKNVKVIVVHKQNGTKYLRSCPGQPTFDQLIS